ncbi:MAG TPA: family 16 glycosylhydrolase, partial [Tepidisphaeraceae bacterium]|nr:family 16 glycosylhydrolase [Tepidisphaeraceae bacterium]
MTWSDEFNSGSTATDLAGWSYDIGNGQSGWGNNEQEYYTNSAANVSVSTTGGVGALHIDAIKQSINGYNYSSARIKTNTVFSQTYGVIEFRAKLPAGQGLWPAVWMMPENSTYGGWPTSGEIDILESKGQETSLVQGSLHSGPAWNQEDNQTQTFSGSGLEPQGFSTTAWHTYDLEWDNGSPGTFKWYVDGVAYETQTGGWYVPSHVPIGDREAPFDQPFYLLINLAVGGNYSGTPNLASNTPYDMAIDYVRAYSSFLLGDTNNDGVVNASDFDTMMHHFGQSVTGGFTDGDFNNDGVVNS